MADPKGTGQSPYAGCAAYEHYEMCDGFDCPCFKDGWWMTALSHLDVLDQFCQTDPTLVRERLALAEAGRG